MIRRRRLQFVTKALRELGLSASPDVAENLRNEWVDTTVRLILGSRWFAKWQGNKFPPLEEEGAAPRRGEEAAQEEAASPQEEGERTAQERRTQDRTQEGGLDPRTRFYPSSGGDCSEDGYSVSSVRTEYRDEGGGGTKDSLLEFKTPLESRTKESGDVDPDEEDTSQIIGSEERGSGAGRGELPFSFFGEEELGDKGGPTPKKYVAYVPHKIDTHKVGGGDGGKIGGPAILDREKEEDRRWQKHWNDENSVRFKLFVAVKEFTARHYCGLEEVPHAGPLVRQTATQLLPFLRNVPELVKEGEEDGREASGRTSVDSSPLPASRVLAVSWEGSQVCSLVPCHSLYASASSPMSQVQCTYCHRNVYMSRKKQGVRNTTKTIIAIHDASPGCKTEQKASSENFFVARPILPPGSPCRPDAQHLVAPPAKETGFPFTGVVTKFSSVLDTWSGATFLDRQAENKAKRLDHDHAWRGQHANWVEKHLTSVKEEQKQDLAKRIKKIAHQRREAAEGGSCWRRKVLSDGLGEQEREDVVLDSDIVKASSLEPTSHGQDLSVRATRVSQELRGLPMEHQLRDALRNNKEDLDAVLNSLYEVRRATAKIHHQISARAPLRLAKARGTNLGFAPKSASPTRRVPFVPAGRGGGTLSSSPIHSKRSRLEDAPLIAKSTYGGIDLSPRRGNLHGFEDEEEEDSISAQELSSSKGGPSSKGTTGSSRRGSSRRAGAAKNRGAVLQRALAGVSENDRSTLDRVKKLDDFLSGESSVDHVPAGMSHGYPHRGRRFYAKNQPGNVLRTASLKADWSRAHYSLSSRSPSSKNSRGRTSETSDVPTSERDPLSFSTGSGPGLRALGHQQAAGLTPERAEQFLTQSERHKREQDRKRRRDLIEREQRLMASEQSKTVKFEMRHDGSFVNRVTGVVEEGHEEMLHEDDRRRQGAVVEEHTALAEAVLRGRRRSKEVWRRKIPGAPEERGTKIAVTSSAAPEGGVMAAAPEGAGVEVPEGAATKSPKRAKTPKSTSPKAAKAKGKAKAGVAARGRKRPSDEGETRGGGRGAKATRATGVGGVVGGRGAAGKKQENQEEEGENQDGGQHQGGKEEQDGAGGPEEEEEEEVVAEGEEPLTKQDAQSKESALSAVSALSKASALSKVSSQSPRRPRVEYSELPNRVRKKRYERNDDVSVPDIAKIRVASRENK